MAKKSPRQASTATQQASGADGKPQRSLAERLATACAAYQEASVIPHCPSCASPCCKLDKLVLDLDWQQVKTLWQIEQSRAAFDRRLQSTGQPEEIRAANGRYYIHSKPCPAYESGSGCRIYDQPLKPVGCSDFPVYEDAGVVVADLRCEAVDLEQLRQQISAALGPDQRLQESADRDFPFLVELSVKPAGRR